MKKKNEKLNFPVSKISRESPILTGKEYLDFLDFTLRVSPPSKDSLKEDKKNRINQIFRF